MSTSKMRGHQPPRVPAQKPGTAGGARDINRRRRIAQICDAALALFLEHGIGAVTIDQIVERAGVAKGSFYRYFKDQAELVETMLGPLDEAIRAALAHAEERLGAAKGPAELPAIYLAMSAELASLAREHRDLLRLYLQECRSPAAGARRPLRLLADDITARALRISTIARDFGLLRDTDPRIGALTVIGAVERLSFAVLSGEDVGKLEALPATLVSMILDGVAKRR